jgi:hypothetical protein
VCQDFFRRTSEDKLPEDWFDAARCDKYADTMTVPKKHLSQVFGDFSNDLPGAV